MLAITGRIFGLNEEQRRRLVVQAEEDTEQTVSREEYLANFGKSDCA